MKEPIFVSTLQLVYASLYFLLVESLKVLTWYCINAACVPQ